MPRVSSKSKETKVARAKADIAATALVDPAAASDAGFTCILTRDKLFQESASKVLKHRPKMAIVLLVLPQGRGRLYLESFKMEWQKKPITPIPGQVVLWP